MKEEQKYLWEKVVTGILLDPYWANLFTQKVLGLTANLEVPVEKVIFHLEERDVHREGVEFFALVKEPSLGNRYHSHKRWMHFLLNSDQEASITLVFDCFEAPSILLDRGYTKLHVTVDEKFLRFIRLFAKKMQSEKERIKI